MMDAASLLTSLIWNIGDERLQVALHEVVDYAASATENEEPIEADTVLTIIGECLTFGHTHEGMDVLEIHILPHEPLKTEEEIEESVAEFRKILGTDKPEEDK